MTELMEKQPSFSDNRQWSVFLVCRVTSAWTSGTIGGVAAWGIRGWARLIGGRTGPAEVDREGGVRSQAELAAGRLPVSAQDRLRSHVGEQPFAGAIAGAGLAALLSAGYRPVGQAFGVAAFTVSTAQSYFQSGLHRGVGGDARPGRPVELRGYYQGLIAARAAALRRLALECDALGGSGVVGLRMLPPTSRDASWLDVVVVGTAVRHESGSSSSPFVTTLDAADVAALHRAGWCPNGVVFEQVRFFAHAGYGIPIGVGMRRYRDPSQSIGPATDVLAFAQSEVRARLAQRVRQRGGAGMLTQQFDSSWDDHECSMAPTQSDVTADVVAVGNVIARRAAAVRDRRVDADAVVPLTGGKGGVT